MPELVNEDAPLIEVEFAGANLACSRKGDDVYVSLRRACDNIGLGYGSQFRKLQNKSWATIITMITVAEDGRNREHTMLHLDTLSGWLFSIDENRVAAEVRPNLIRYQKECAQVLRDHFFPKDQPLSPLSTGDILVQYAQAYKVQEERMNRLEASQHQIAEEMTTRFDQLETEIESAGAVPPKTMRAQINELVQGFVPYGSKTGYKSAWLQLYREYRLRYKVNLTVRAKNAEIARLDWAESYGHLYNLWCLAKELFSEESVRTPNTSDYSEAKALFAEPTE